MNDDRLKLILELHKEGKITTTEALILMKGDKMLIDQTPVDPERFRITCWPPEIPARPQDVWWYQSSQS